MAKYNEILVGRFNRFLQKLLGIKADAPSPQLAGEIMPVIPMFNGVENRYLESWERFSFQFNTGTPAAGNFANVQLRNPIAANVIVVVERIFVFNIGGLVDQPGWFLVTNATDLSTLGNPNALDTRGRPKPSSIVSSQTNGIAPTIFYEIVQIGVGGPGQEFILNENQEIPVLPNQTLRLSSNVAATGLVGFMLWRERYIEEGERT